MYSGNDKEIMECWNGNPKGANQNSGQSMKVQPDYDWCKIKAQQEDWNLDKTLECVVE